MRRDLVGLRLKRFGLIAPCGRFQGKKKKEAAGPVCRKSKKRGGFLGGGLLPRTGNAQKKREKGDKRVWSGEGGKKAKVVHHGGERKDSPGADVFFWF